MDLIALIAVSPFGACLLHAEILDTTLRFIPHLKNKGVASWVVSSTNNPANQASHLIRLRLHEN
jgi:hypothetical protein